MLKSLLDLLNSMTLSLPTYSRKVVSRRKHHEYKLCRRAKHIQDFMDYVQYELHILALIGNRREVSEV